MVAIREVKVRRMCVREFRAAVRSDVVREAPIVVTTDGADAFAVVSFHLISEWHRRMAEKGACVRSVERP